MTQRPLFSEAPARQHDGLPPFQHHSQTSREAAIAILPDLGPLEQRVLDFLRSCGDYGSTDEEGIAATGMAANTYRPRRVALWNKHNLLERNGKRPCRSGRDADVWVVKR